MGCLIGYIKGKEEKGIITRNPKVLKAVMFCDYNYATDRDTRKSVSSIVATLGGTILTCSSKSHRTVTFISKEAECMAVLACAKEGKLLTCYLNN